MNKEILLVAEVVSNEKGVDKDVIFQAIEAALETATKKKAGEEVDVKVEINRKTGDYMTARRWLVVDETQLSEEETVAGEPGVMTMTLQEAKQRDPKAHLGAYVYEPMESVEFGRIAAQKAKKSMASYGSFSFWVMVISPVHSYT